MSKAVLLETNDGYEALYIDEKLVESGNPLNEGNSRLSILITWLNYMGFYWMK